MGSDWLSERIVFDNEHRYSDLDYWGARICWTIACANHGKGRKPKLEDFQRRPPRRKGNGQSFQAMCRDVAELVQGG